MTKSEELPPLTPAEIQAQHNEAHRLDKETILGVTVGSTAHGISRGDLSDRDEIYVYLPPIYDVIGIQGRKDGYNYRPGRRKDDPSQPGDIDRQYYSLPHFVHLLVNKSNPHTLFSLFAPDAIDSTALGAHLRSFRSSFRTEKTKTAYFGYATAQYKRAVGEAGSAGRMRRSPEGGGDIDWKYLMHTIRLLVEGEHYLRTGEIPVPSTEREMLLGIRYGEYSFDQWLSIYDHHLALLRGVDVNGHDVGAEVEGWMLDIMRKRWFMHPRKRAYVKVSTDR